MAVDLDGLKWDAAGLVTVVAQDHLTGEVRMVAHASRDALARTLETREAHFFSRSRGALWKKGESSGHVLTVRDVWLDCDRDALVYLVEPHGPTCHTGAESCFFAHESAPTPAPGRALPLLARLEAALVARASAAAEKSYTRSLLDRGAETVGGKIREEADELARAIAGESDERVVAEAADLVYHVMVGLLLRRVPVRAVLGELARRFGTSGHAEKAARPRA